MHGRREVSPDLGSVPFENSVPDSSLQGFTLTVIKDISTFYYWSQLGRYDYQLLPIPTKFSYCYCYHSSIAPCRSDRPPSPRRDSQPVLVSLFTWIENKSQRDAKTALSCYQFILRIINNPYFFHTPKNASVITISVILIRFGLNMLFILAQTSVNKEMGVQV